MSILAQVLESMPRISIYTLNQRVDIGRPIPPTPIIAWVGGYMTVRHCTHVGRRVTWPQPRQNFRQYWELRPWKVQGGQHVLFQIRVCCHQGDMAVRTGDFGIGIGWVEVMQAIGDVLHRRAPE